LRIYFSIALLKQRKAKKCAKKYMVTLRWETDVSLFYPQRVKSPIKFIKNWSFYPRIGKIPH